MQKNYIIIILFCFFISNTTIAELSNDLAHFAQTLNNVAAMLEAVQFSTSKLIKTITLPPLTWEAILPDGTVVKAPWGTIIEVRDAGILVKVEIDIEETTVKFPYAGFLEISDAASVEFPNGKSAEIPFGGSTIKVPAGTTKIKPKNPIPPVPGGKFSAAEAMRLTVPDDGVVVLPNGEVIKVPVGSAVLIYPFGLEITTPITGGDVRLPSTGGRIGIADMFNATLQLPNGFSKEISSNEYAKIFMEGVVKVIPKDTLPPVGGWERCGVSKTRKVPGGETKKLFGVTITNAPEETIVEKLHDGVVVTVSPAGADVTMPTWYERIGLPKDSAAVMVELPDGRWGKIVGGGYIRVPKGTTKIRPITRKKPKIGEIKLPEE